MTTQEPNKVWEKATEHDFIYYVKRPTNIGEPEYFSTIPGLDLSKGFLRLLSDPSEARDWLNNLGDDRVLCINNNPLADMAELETLPPQALDMYLEFGSLYDWTPVLEDYTFSFLPEDGETESQLRYDRIIQNINKDSPYYKSLGIKCMDNHDRLRLFKLDLSIEEIVDKIAILYKKDKDILDGFDGWDRTLNMPIKLLMEELGLEAHYG